MLIVLSVGLLPVAAQEEDAPRQRAPREGRGAPGEVNREGDRQRDMQAAPERRERAQQREAGRDRERQQFGDAQRGPREEMRPGMPDRPQRRPGFAGPRMGQGPGPMNRPFAQGNRPAICPECNRPFPPNMNMVPGGRRGLGPEMGAVPQGRGRQLGWQNQDGPMPGFGPGPGPMARGQGRGWAQGPQGGPGFGPPPFARGPGFNGPRNFPGNDQGFVPGGPQFRNRPPMDDDDDDRRAPEGRQQNRRLRAPADQD